MRVSTANGGGSAHLWYEDVAAHETCRDADRTNGFHHEHCEVAAAAAAAPKRLARTLHTLLGPAQILEVFVDATRHRVQQRHRRGSGRLQELRRPCIEIAARILTRQGLDEIGLVVIGIAKRIALRADLELVVRQRCLDVLDRDRAVEPKLRRHRFVEGDDGHRVVEDVVNPANARRVRQDIQLRAEEPEIVALTWPKHHAMFAKSHWLRISIAGDVPHCENTHLVSRAHLASPAQTVKSARVVRPNVLLIATSVASRPRAISTRPIRGTLFRASNVCQRPPI